MLSPSTPSEPKHLWCRCSEDNGFRCTCPGGTLREYSCSEEEGGADELKCFSCGKPGDHGFFFFDMQIRLKYKYVVRGAVNNMSDIMTLRLCHNCELCAEGRDITTIGHDWWDAVDGIIIPIQESRHYKEYVIGNSTKSAGHR